MINASGDQVRSASIEMTSDHEKALDRSSSVYRLKVTANVARLFDR